MRFDRAKNLPYSSRLFAAFGVLVLAFFVSLPSADSSTLTATSPISVSFLPSGEGWALSTYHCQSGLCAEVEKSVNAGRSWKSERLPTRLQNVVKSATLNYFPSLSPSIYFANSLDGWIYGSTNPPTSSTGTYLPPTAELWATHDGGGNWTAVDVSSFGMKFGVLSLSANEGRLYAVAWSTDQTFGLWSSAVASNHLHRIATPTLPTAAGGSSMEAALVFKGAGGWLTVG